MRRVSPPLVPFALALFAGCAASVEPADPLIGTWRGEPSTRGYPAASDLAEVTQEFAFTADGIVVETTTRRYTSGRYAGCTWIETDRRHWRNDSGASPAVVVIELALDYRRTNERSGCADPAMNRPRSESAEPPPLAMPSGGAYTITEPTLTIEWSISIPAGHSATRTYRRVR